MNKKILFADDETYTRELYADLLKEAGYEVTAVTNGEEAYTEASKGGFDLILMDIIMPKKDGVTFLKEFPQIKGQNPSAKIVMTTVLGEDPIIRSCLELGAVGYLIKSEVTPDNFIKEIKNYLS